MFPSLFVLYVKPVHPQRKQLALQPFCFCFHSWHTTSLEVGEEAKGCPFLISISKIIPSPNSLKNHISFEVHAVKFHLSNLSFCMPTSKEVSKVTGFLLMPIFLLTASMWTSTQHRTLSSLTSSFPTILSSPLLSYPLQWAYNPVTIINYQRAPQISISKISVILESPIHIL